jgi:hypothetical protein
VSLNIEEIVNVLHSLMSGRHEAQINWPAESMGHGALKQRERLGMSESLLYPTATSIGVTYMRMIRLSLDPPLIVTMIVSIVRAADPAPHFS